jgi:tetratricopeptide (TPR) repeat protein
MRDQTLCAIFAIALLAVAGLSAGAPTPAPHLSEPDKLDQQVQELFKAGKYSEAIPPATQCLHLREQALGPEHPFTVLSLNNLAQLYVNMGDYAKAEPLLQRALKILEKAAGPEHPVTALSLNNLAMLYDKMRDYVKAEPLYQGALKINEKALGPEHPDTAISLNNLMTLYLSMGDYVEAEYPRLQRAAYAKAEPLYQRALKITEKTLGPDHPATGTSLNNLALLYTGMGNPKEALRLAAQARRVRERNLSDILSFSSEQQRLAFQKTTHPYNLPATLGNAPELAEAVLRQKGVVLDSLLEDRLVAEASGDPKQREIIERLRAAKQRLTQLQLEVPKDLSEQAQKQRADEKEKLSTEVEQLEGGPRSASGRLGPRQASAERDCCRSASRPRAG